MKRGLPRGGLKTIACVAMLIDHVGAVFFDRIWLRIIGRAAFPIYCFLLAEGAAFTRSRRNYALRLLAVAVLSELPFDYAIYGTWTMQHQNVMFTLLAGLLAIYAMDSMPEPWMKAVATVPFLLGTNLLHSDYGGGGVLLIAVFAVLRSNPHSRILDAAALAACLYITAGAPFLNADFTIPMELSGLTALIPIWLYNGHKRTDSRVVQRGFYLFFPAHLAVIALIRELI